MNEFIWFLVGVIATLLFYPRSGVNNFFSRFNHQHNFIPVEWDDALWGSPFWCFEGADDPSEHYARKCSCGEVNHLWVGPESDRDPEAPPYRGAWTKDSFLKWCREETKRKIALSRRLGY